MQLSVIIVNYNVKYYLEQCLLSLEKALQGIDSEVIVFDNHSRDGSVEYLTPRFPKVRIIANNHNLGFAKANNRAILQSQGKYVLLLNPDTIVGEYTLRKAINFMEGHEMAGCTGVRMMKDDGADAMESRRGIPSPLTAFYKMSGLCNRFPESRRLGRYYMGWLPWDQPSPIEIVSGAFCLLRREALDKAGFLDEDFFMYGEDIDLSYRILKVGYENWYLPYRILHYKGESTQKSSFRYVHVFYEAMLIFFRKHYSHLSLLIALPIQLAIYAKASASLLRTLNKKIHRSLGFKDKTQQEDRLYIFNIASGNLSECQQLSHRCGLWSEFHDANVNDVHIPAKTKKNCRTYIVFDASAYTYEEMFDHMARNKESEAHLAVYYPKSNIIITDREIIL